MKDEEEENRVEKEVVETILSYAEDVNNRDPNDTAQDDCKVRDHQRLRARLKTIEKRKEQEFKTIQAKHHQDTVAQMGADTIMAKQEDVDAADDLERTLPDLLLLRSPLLQVRLFWDQLPITLTSDFIFEDIFVICCEGRTWGSRQNIYFFFDFAQQVLTIHELQEA